MRRLTLPLLLVLLAVIVALVMCEPTAVEPVDGPAERASEAEIDPSPDELPGRRERARAPRVATANRAPAAVDETATGQWRIRVLGRDDAPIAGVRVEVTEETPEEQGAVLEMQSTHRTDANGVTYADPLPAGSTGTVRCDNLETAAVPYEPETVLRIEDALPVTVAPVDGWSGAPLPVDVLLLGSATPLALERDGALRRVAASPVRPGRTGHLAFRIEAAPERSIPWTTVAWGEISALADELHVTAAVPREVQLTVRVTDSSDLPVAGAELADVHRGGWIDDVMAGVASDAAGVLVVRRTPFFRGDRIAVGVFLANRYAVSNEIVLREVDQAIRLHAHVPDDADPKVSDHNEVDVESPDYRRPSRWLDEAGAASLHVQVRTRRGERAWIPVSVLTDGQPRDRGWRVWTDAHGVAEFRGLPPGRCKVIVTDPGLTCSVTDVTLGTGEARRLEVRDPAGRPLTIRVVDHDGVALPFAELRLSRDVAVGFPNVRVAHVVDGVQHLPIVTDQHGVLRLTDAPPGEIEIMARYGHRSATVDGAASEIVVRLPER